MLMYASMRGYSHPHRAASNGCAPSGFHFARQQVGVPNWESAGHIGASKRAGHYHDRSASCFWSGNEWVLVIVWIGADFAHALCYIPGHAGIYPRQIINRRPADHDGYRQPPHPLIRNLAPCSIPSR